MPSLARLVFDRSQFPENVRRDLIESLGRREINHKFHYDSVKQGQKWLALHQACSPARNDPDCAAIYDRSFIATANRVEAKPLHVIGLGCGGGQKDSRLLQLVSESMKELFYTPCDVSSALVLTAYQSAIQIIPENNCLPLVCDLATAEELPATLQQAFGLRFSTASQRTEPARLFTFFGMLPNFEPGVILPRLSGLLRAGDGLLLSANLAPGADYLAGVQRVLPQYDNALTRDWLMTFLLDLGVERNDGQLRFAIEDSTESGGAKRITVFFDFHRQRRIVVDAHAFEFKPGESIRLFFSWRHTPELVRSWLARHGLKVLEHWTTQSREEGVFLATRPKPHEGPWIAAVL